MSFKVVVFPAVWIHVFPLWEPNPILNCFNAPPKPPIGCPFQWASTIILSKSSRCPPNWTQMDDYLADQIDFTNAMGDAASTIVKHFRNKGGIVFINVMSNISLWCDWAGDLAPVPRIHDMGILASTDPVALDQACLDLIKEHWDVGTDELLEQIKNLTGENTIEAAVRHKMGEKEYNLICIDPDYTALIIVCIVDALFIIGGIVGFVIYKKRKKPIEGVGKISLINKSMEKEE